MKEKNVLYQIKDLEKTILRNFLMEDEMKDIKAITHPTPTQMEIMGYIIDNRDKEIYQKDLENILNLRRATVSGVLQTMEKNGLIIRITDEQDTRTKRIILNEKSKEMFRKHEKRVDEIVKIATKDIDDEELQNFCKTIQKMKENLMK